MKRVVIVGVGALGSHVVQFLRSTEVTLKVIDFDRVEQKNVLSQFHGKPHVSKSKVQALAQSMNMLWGVKIETNPHKLTADNVVNMLGDADLIIDCLDNGEGRRVIQRYVQAEDVPCLHGALAADGAMGRVIWDEYFRIDDGASGAATCEDGDFLPFIGMVSTYLARSAQEFLATGKKLNFQVYPLSAATQL